jgi:hypothetical protein
VADVRYISAGHILTVRNGHGITLLEPVGADTRQTRRSRNGQEPALAQGMRPGFPAVVSAPALSDERTGSTSVLRVRTCRVLFPAAGVTASRSG